MTVAGRLECEIPPLRGPIRPTLARRECDACLVLVMPRSLVLTFATILLGAAPLLAEEAPSFVNDVVPLFTKLGCNQGACHGKAAGQNGFRLSLRGFAPEQDHVSITREFAGRRINPAVPEQSLLLQKPT